MQGVTAPVMSVLLWCSWEPQILNPSFTFQPDAVRKEVKKEEASKGRYGLL